MKPRAKLMTSTIALGCALLVASAATAQAPPKSGASPLETSQAEARTRFNEGIALADAGDHEGARLKFGQAWALFKSPAVLYNLARAEQLSGHLLESLEHYRLFIKMSSDPKVTDTQRKRAKENIAELSKKVGQLDIEAPLGARVSVDGRTVDAAAGEPIPVTTGRHVVEAIVDGKLRSVTVDAQPGVVGKAKLVEAPPPAAPSSSGGASADAASRAPDKAAPSAPEHAAAGSTLFTTRNVVAMSLGIASVVAAGVALGFLVDSNAKATDAKGFNAGVPGGACDRLALPSCAEYTSKLDDATSSRTISYVAFAGAGLFAAGAATAFAMWPTTSSKASLRAVITGSTLGLRAEY